MQQARIQAVEKVTPHLGNNGTTYYFTLQFENGDKGTIGKKREDAFKAGDALMYELIPNQNPKFPPIIKEIKPDNQLPSAKKNVADLRSDAERNKSFSLSYAKDLVVAVTPHGYTDASAEDLADLTCKLASRFLNWFETGE